VNRKGAAVLKPEAVEKLQPGEEKDSRGTKADTILPLRQIAFPRTDKSGEQSLMRDGNFHNWGPGGSR